MPSKNRHLLRLIRRRAREPHGANAISRASRSFVQASKLGAADIAIEGTAALSRLAAAAQTEQCPPRRLISRRVVRRPCSAPLSVSPRRRSGLSPLCRPAHAARGAEPPIISGIRATAHCFAACFAVLRYFQTRQPLA